MASRPKPQSSKTLQCHVRTVCKFEIDIANPLDEIIEFDIDIRGAGLDGENRLLLDPKEERKFTLTYKPLVCKISFYIENFTVFLAPDIQARRGLCSIFQSKSGRILVSIITKC